MTTIAASRLCMAADTNVVIGEGDSATYFEGSSKVHRIGDTLVGCAGYVSAIGKFLTWYSKRNKRIKKPEFTDEEDLSVLILTPTGLFHCDKSLDIDEVKSAYFAIGSGGQIALTAMDMGGDPKRAIEAACVRDGANTKAPIQVFYLKGHHANA